MRQTTVPSPTLRTIKMVEKALEEAENSVTTVAELKRSLPRKVNHSILMEILQYLEESNKIYVGLKGITWIHHDNPKLREAIRKGRRL